MDKQERMKQAILIAAHVVHLYADTGSKYGAAPNFNCRVVAIKFEQGVAIRWLEKGGEVNEFGMDHEDKVGILGKVVLMLTQAGITTTEILVVDSLSAFSKGCATK